jgi:hypothetical protein
MVGKKRRKKGKSLKKSAFILFHLTLSLSSHENTNVNLRLQTG